MKFLFGKVAKFNVQTIRFELKWKIEPVHLYKQEKKRGTLAAFLFTKVHLDF